jgi:Uncharacterized protein conserved in bacteria (DUF2188)
VVRRKHGAPVGPIRALLLVLPRGPISCPGERVCTPPERVGRRMSMATRTDDRTTVEFEIVPDEVDGWDVKKRGEVQALSNHPTRELAEEAAWLRGEEEEADDVRITVDEKAVHHVDDESRGVRTTIVALVGLLALITLLIVVVSLVGSLTEFGA